MSDSGSSSESELTFKVTLVRVAPSGVDRDSVQAEEVFMPASNSGLVCCGRISQRAFKKAAIEEVGEVGGSMLLGTSIETSVM